MRPSELIGLTDPTPALAFDLAMAYRSDHMDRRNVEGERWWVPVQQFMASLGFTGDLPSDLPSDSGGEGNSDPKTAQEDIAWL